jgi:hypothetical protein
VTPPPPSSLGCNDASGNTEYVHALESWDSLVTVPLMPEAQARVLIDEQLSRAGWHICVRKLWDIPA